jgi:hypothetical protein
VTSAGVHVVPTSTSLPDVHAFAEQKHEPSVRRQQCELVHAGTKKTMSFSVAVSHAHPFA